MAIERIGLGIYDPPQPRMVSDLMKHIQTGTVPTYRTDINGLRGIAVMAVTLFHFGVSGFEGGFVGVDVFYVISGFLMTRIVLGDLSKSRFSFARFYMSRFARIYPPILALVLSGLVLGYYFLTPEE